MRWSLSYRVRAIVLIGLLTGAAIAATAWISARSTATQLSDSVYSQQADIELIANQLRQYGVVHGVWGGVPALTLALERQTSQRIRLTTQDGEVVVDTDTLHGRAARETTDRSPVAIVPRPDLDLTGLDALTSYRVTMKAIATYRSTVRMAACLTEHGVTIATTGTDAYGLPRISYDAGTAASAGCAVRPSSATESAADQEEVDHCLVAVKTPLGLGASGARVNPAGGDADSDPTRRCLVAAFQQRTVADDAVTLLLYTGFRGAPRLHVDARRVALASIPILILAIACAALLSRQVLRPVDAVIRASRRLEAGQRDARVPEVGHDEMTALALAFNRMADSVQSSDAQQRRLTADIAHELRTPLANIRGYLEALKDGVLAPTPEVFESLHEEALLQQRTIDDLQDLALADRHRLIDQRIRIDLGELMRTARAVHAARAEAAGVALAVDAQPNLYVDADPDRLRQAIGNLLTNALRATPRGGSITITARRRDRFEVEMSVADTGHGIEPEHLPHIFERFWRADPSRARDTGGTGLGLAISNEIIHGHGGAMAVASTPGRGTTFTITLPAAGGN